MNQNKIENINTTCDSNKTFEQLVIDNKDFVYSVVNKEFKTYPWNIKNELYSAGIEGLVYAATKFKPTEYNNKFISYAVHWIRYYINEEIRKMYPVKLNQNYMYKRGKIKKFTAKFVEEHGREPSNDEISEGLGISKKVINNILSINNGENFQFVSFQAVNNEGSDDNISESYVENKLINEYLEETVSDYGMTNFELQDLLSVLKKQVPEKDYNMFVDKHLNGLSYSDIAKKYGLNFPSSSKYVIERVEKTCKTLLQG